MNYMLMPLKRYFDFSGRSRRKEYWMFVLLYLVLYIGAGILDVALGLGGTHDELVRIRRRHRVGELQHAGRHPDA